MKKSFKNISYLVCALALSLFVAGCGKSSTDPAELYKQASVLAKNGAWDKALPLAEKANNLMPADVDIAVLYATALENNKEKEKAAAVLKKSIDSNPNNFLPQYALGRLYFNAGEYEGAYDKLANAYKIAPKNLDVLVLYAQCAGKLMAQNTATLYNQLEKTPEYSNNPLIYSELGVYYTNIRDNSKAIQNLVKAYKMDKTNPVYCLNLGVFCDKNLKQAQKAKYFYMKFLSFGRDKAEFAQTIKEVQARIKSL